jgi:biotin carboxyl carrier protein|tara:strand:+ start:103 stop:615 length:513 start_codon:yes stop_codon:yes gene_type:complete
MKVSAKINNNASVEFIPDAKTPLQGRLNNEKFEIEIIKKKDNELLISRDGKKHVARLLAIDSENKTITLKIDGNRFEVKLTDEYDILLQSLGMDAASTKKVNELKAPMPGVVVDIVVSIGDTVVKDDPLVVLEAMKMENMLKSPSDGVISSINIKKGETVEKNRVLVNFE